MHTLYGRDNLVEKHPSGRTTDPDSLSEFDDIIVVQLLAMILFCLNNLLVI